MMILIAGGNGSGKSAYAERLAAQMGEPRFYVATMVSQSPENEQRIEKHRRQRAGLAFHTIEEPCHVGKAAVTEDSVVLLEDASNLLGNMLFADHGTAEQALGEILALQKRCRHLLVVTISGLPETQYTGETADYIRALTWLNQRLFAHSDAAVEMQNEAPVIRKGMLDDYF